jgi:hypothetical protein
VVGKVYSLHRRKAQVERNTWGKVGLVVGLRLGVKDAGRKTFS